MGEGLTGVSVGDDVPGRGSNSQAEYAVLDAWAGMDDAFGDVATLLPGGTRTYTSATWARWRSRRTSRRCSASTPGCSRAVQGVRGCFGV
jgi:hypothetical protein